MLNYKQIVALIVAIIIVVLIALWWWFYEDMTPKRLLPTIGQYSFSQLQSLKSEKPINQIQVADIQKWDDITFDLVRKNELGDLYAGEVYAELAVAQRDAAYLSYNNSGYFAGSLDAVSRQVLCINFPKNCNDLPSYNPKDTYSIKLAELVIPHIQQRNLLIKDQDKLLYAEKTGADNWLGNRPFYGQGFGSWKPWVLSSGNQFRVKELPPAPNSAASIEELRLVRQAFDHITSEQKMLVVFWAGGPGTITPPGQWMKITNDYLWSHHIPLAKVFLVRSVIGMAMADAGIAVFDSKYTYWAKRPFMLDKTIVSVMPTPNHPSYPAAHATFSAAAATILSYYFPENTKEWHRLAHQASDTRLWGGIHFSIDSSVGYKLGTTVANYVIQLEK